MAASGVDVRVENQLVRFVPTSPVDHEACYLAVGRTKKR